MKTYIALLRGINVSGHKKVPMSELRELLEELKLNRVKTYIQSGNVVFDAAGKDSSLLAESIEKKIAQQFGFEVAVLVIGLADFKKALEQNPFLQEPGMNPDLLYTTFLATAPAAGPLAKLQEMEPTLAPERLVIKDTIAYVYCSNGYGNTKIHNNFLEKSLKVTGTTRNLKTIRALISLAEPEEHR